MFLGFGVESYWEEAEFEAEAMAMEGMAEKKQREDSHPPITR